MRSLIIINLVPTAFPLHSIQRFWIILILKTVKILTQSIGKMCRPMQLNNFRLSDNMIIASTMNCCFAREEKSLLFALSHILSSYSDLFRFDYSIFALSESINIKGEAMVGKSEHRKFWCGDSINVMYHLGHEISIRQRSIFCFHLYIRLTREHLLLCYSVTDRFARSADKFCTQWSQIKLLILFRGIFQATLRTVHWLSLVVDTVILRGEALAEWRRRKKTVLSFGNICTYSISLSKILVDYIRHTAHHIRGKL